MNIVLPYGITKLIYDKSITGTPALCYRSTGVVKVNANIWHTIHPDHQYFILCHEAGHIVLNTTNEYEADRYAFEQYVRSGRSLKQSIYALSKILTFTTLQHHYRLEDQLQRALEYDYIVNNNLKANKQCKKI